MLVFIYNRGLSKELLKNIKEKKYSEEQIKSLYLSIKNEYLKKKKALIIIALGLVVISTAFSWMGFYHYGYMHFLSTFVLPLSILLAGSALVIVWTKINMVDKEKRQFNKVAKEAYPVIMEHIS